jgi:hypothetical protein
LSVLSSYFAGGKKEEDHSPVIVSLVSFPGFEEFGGTKLQEPRS